ncbi:MAG TPA: hypothetical protein VFU16_07860 [Solirubrobacterales bacterium]|nr:hypothetical protein [Solirubrobacterales bacterium]
MSDAETAYAELASAEGFEQLPGFGPGPLTPLLSEALGNGLAPALRGDLGDGVSGVVGQLAYKRNKTFRFHVALTEVPAATVFAPRVFCIRRGRSTRDDEFYGFEARHSKLWTESTALNERFAVSTSPYQDPIWLRRLFSPSFVDWLRTAEPVDFSFELAYGALLGSVEEDDPGAEGLAALCKATAHVATRIREECEE